MIQWKDQEVQALCGFIFRLVAVFSTGLYVWYWLLSLHKVEWALLTRRMRFTWAHISYFTARYCHLITVLTVIISTNVEQILLNCGSSAVLKVAAILGNIALAAASTNLGLRAVAMWQDIRFIKIGLAVICAVHGLLAVIMGLESVQAKWNSVHSVCMVLTSKSQPQLVSFYTFTLAWDLIILVFTLAGMCRQRLPTRSPLWATIVSQGLGYVLISCATCIPMMIMVSLNLNNTMNVILTAPGCTICVITSSAFVTSLLEMRGPDSSASPNSRLKPARAIRLGKNECVSFTTHIELYASEDRHSSDIADDYRIQEDA